MFLVCGIFDLFYNKQLNGIHNTVKPAEVGQIKGRTVLANSTTFTFRAEFHFTSWCEIDVYEGFVGNLIWVDGWVMVGWYSSHIIDHCKSS